jgi:hypothetical protein
MHPKMSFFFSFSFKNKLKKKTKDLSILLIKEHEYKAITSQNIKLCKIIATSCYEVT